MPNQAMPITTASAAPVLTPRMPGSASGLRVTPCITVPATPRAAPARTASRVLGTLKLTAASAIVSLEPESPATVSLKDVVRVPIETERRHKTARIAKAPASPDRWRLRDLQAVGARAW